MKTNAQGTVKGNAVPTTLVATNLANTTSLKRHDKTITVLSSEIKFLQSQRLETVNEIIDEVLVIAKTDKHISEMTGKAKRRRTALKLYRNGISSKELSPYSKRALSAAGKLVELDLLNDFKWRLFPLSKLELILRTNETFIKRLHKEHREAADDDYVQAFIAEIKAEAQTTVKRAVKRYDGKKLSSLK